MMDSTKHQILTIESREIVKFLMDVLCNNPDTETMNKVQMMFNIINDNDINHGIEKIDGDR